VKPFESRWERFLPYFLGIIFGLTIALFAVSIFMFRQASSPGTELTIARRTGGTASIDEERSGAIIEATRLVSPAVVSITTTRTEILQLPVNQWFERFFFGRRPPRQYRRSQSTLGSGFIVNQHGYIMTNEHVVRNAEEIRITLNDGSEALAAVVGTSRRYDIAVLKIEGSAFPYVTLGDSDRLLIGEWVIAIGSPFGHLLNDTQPTVTVGVISALMRDVTSDPREAVFMNMIQTDAAINPGNSGGPLVSSTGEVVGINTFIFSGGEGGNLGMGFAIPVNTARLIYDEITTYGRVRPVWTGLEVRELTPEVAASLGFTIDVGLLVEAIHDNSPAYKAGVKVGDIILEVNGRQVLDFNQANRSIHGLRVGDALELRVQRGNELLELDLELMERPQTI
jgi:serine protease Do